MGETFGRYQLLGLLGQGGMGRLYIAERRGIQGFVKIVALKRIQPHLADSKQLREMFLNEARIAARLEHPNIVATYELGEVDSKYFISMEYLPGEDLVGDHRAAARSGRMPVEIAAALTQQAAQGLHYAHEARDGQGKPIGLVHRDVSPRNIFVTYHGVVKLLDFGVVRGPERQKSIPGVFKGKYGYCAPEQIEGGRIDRRTDVFCLGIALWECLTGARLFDASTDATTIDAVRSRPIEPPSTLRPEVPPELDAITLRALARDPARRFPERARHVRGARSLPARARRAPDQKSGGALDGDDLRRRTGGVEEGDQPGRRGRSDAGAVVRARRGQADQRATDDTGSASGPAPPVAMRRRSRARCGRRASAATRRATGGRLASRRADPQRRGSARARIVVGRAHRVRHRRQPGARGARRTRQPAGAARTPRGRQAGGSLPIALGVGLVLGGIGVVAAVALRGERSFPDAPAARGRARDGDAGDTERARRARTCSSTAAPAGCVTPAVLNGPAGGRTVQLSLDKPGYEPVPSRRRSRKARRGRCRSRCARRRACAADRRAAQRDRLPRRSAVEPTSRCRVAGPHRLRVEAADGVVFSNTIEVKMGAELVVDVVSDRSKQ